MAAKGAREPITLECTECKRRTYMTEKNKKNNTERLEITKYCKFCHKIKILKGERQWLKKQKRKKKR